MASTSRKRTSSELNDPPSADGFRTPTGSPSRKKLKITQRQKQALIDNLQLEVTERARKLRAHYALQAQDLRSRIERRINRIPMALRKQNMGELLAKYASPTKKSNSQPIFKKPTIPKQTPIVVPPASQLATTANKNGTVATLSVSKTRISHDSSDKENVTYPDLRGPSLSNPKQRVKGKTLIASSRVQSQFAESKVLSPKSSNSRTFPQSPLRGSPIKSQEEPYKKRAVSPLKPSSFIKPLNPTPAPTTTTRNRAARGATARKPVSQETSSDVSPAKPTRTRKPTTKIAVKKAPSRPVTRQQHTRTISNSSAASGGSAATTGTTGTTVVRSTRAPTGQKKTGYNTTSPATPKKASGSRNQGATASTAASTARKMTATASRKAQAEQPAPGRRVLRSRA
ncbi:hypothetical protein FQN57_004817 [Myotisia sp. PD_48]|nr:hypothetical protein FQN57_004817 [Myotisia sp. PD_48]